MNLTAILGRGNRQWRWGPAEAGPVSEGMDGHVLLRIPWWFGGEGRCGRHGVGPD